MEQAYGFTPTHTEHKNISYSVYTIEIVFLSFICIYYLLCTVIDYIYEEWTHDAIEK